MSPNCLINMNGKKEYTHVEVRYLEQLEEIAIISKLIIKNPDLQDELVNLILPKALRKLDEIKKVSSYE